MNMMGFLLPVAMSWLNQNSRGGRLWPKVERKIAQAFSQLTEEKELTNRVFEK